MESLSSEPLPSGIALFLTTDVKLFFLVAILFLVALSAMFSAFLKAFRLLSRNDIAEMKSKNSTVNNILLDFNRRPDFIESSLSVANILTRITLVFLSTILILGLFSEYHIGWVSAITIFTLLIVVSLFCDVIPHNIASKKKEKVLLNWAVIIRFFVWIFTPWSFLLGQISKTPTASRSNALSGEEFSEVIEIAEGREDLETETQMLKGILRFSDLDVKEIMKSRMDIVAFEWNESLEKVIEIAGTSGYSRIPVYEENIDNIKGILYVKDMLPHLSLAKDFDWRLLVRPPFFVPEFKAVSQLLSDFQLQKIHFAIIVDEYGGTSGIVTLEDIIEEIVGEIVDEYDRIDTSFQKLSENTFSFEAKTNLIDFCKIIGLGDDSVFDSVKGDSDSLAGLILEVKGGIPLKGENIAIGQFVFQVEDANNRRIERVRVTINENEA